MHAGAVIESKEKIRRPECKQPTGRWGPFRERVPPLVHQGSKKIHIRLSKRTWDLSRRTDLRRLGHIVSLVLV